LWSVFVFLYVTVFFIHVTLKKTGAKAIDSNSSMKNQDSIS